MQSATSSTIARGSASFPRPSAVIPQLYCALHASLEGLLQAKKTNTTNAADANSGSDSKFAQRALTSIMTGGLGKQQDPLLLLHKARELIAKETQKGKEGDADEATDSSAATEDILVKHMRAAIRGTFIAMPDSVIASLVEGEEKGRDADKHNDGKPLSSLSVVSQYEVLLRAELSEKEIVDPFALLPAVSTEAEDDAETSSSLSSTTLSDRIRALIKARKLLVWQGDMSVLKCDAVVNPANNALLGCFLPSHKCLDNILHAQAGPRLRLACREVVEGLRSNNNNNVSSSSNSKSPSSARPLAPPFHGDANGQCRVTEAFCLPSKFVFHTVGPNLSGEYPHFKEKRSVPTAQDIADLRSCYETCLAAAMHPQQAFTVGGASVTTTAVPSASLKSIAFCCISTGIFGYPAKEAALLAVETVLSTLEKAVMAEYLKQSEAGDADNDNAVNAKGNAAETTKVLSAIVEECCPLVIFNVFKDEDLAIYQAILS